MTTRARIAARLSLLITLTVGATVAFSPTALAAASGIGEAVRAPEQAGRDTVAGLPGFDDAVVRLTNKQRAAAGCRTSLKSDSRLVKSAQGHADDMAAKHYFSHTSANGRSWDRRISRAGYPDPGGENIAHGFSSAASVVKAWMNSPAHRRNIRDCQFRRIGIGFNPRGDYWVQDFGY